MALMLNERRHANCIAQTFTKCLSLNRAKFDMLMGEARQLMAKKMRVRILQSVPLLAKLSEKKLLELASVMKVQSFNDGAYIIKEGDEGSRFYIINEGEVRCMLPTKEGIEPEEVARLYPQQFFGERALVTNEMRAANIIACGPVECLVLDRTSFEILLADLKTDITDEMAVREADLKREGDTCQRTSNINFEDYLTDGHEFTNHRLEDLKIMRTVGTGTFGRVKVVQHLDGSMYALKCMNKAEIVALHQEKNTLAEKNLLHDCAKCPFVLQLYQTFNRANQIFMLTEFVQGGELWSYIYEKKGAVPRAPDGGFEVEAVKFYSANVVLAFKYMHSKGISYRDLKPENLLVNHDGYLKVIDFGFAKKLPYFKRGVEMDKSYTLVSNFLRLIVYLIDLY
jgi:CRP-like cAMP-binding protein